MSNSDSGALAKLSESSPVTDLNSLLQNPPSHVLQTTPLIATTPSILVADSHPAVPTIEELRSQRRTTFQRLNDITLKTFQECHDRKAVQGGETPAPLPESSQIKLIQQFHGVLQIVLDEVNQKKGESELAVHSGMDLLYAVGRLSMMLAAADFLPADTRPIPMNWMLRHFMTMDPKYSQARILTTLHALRQHDFAPAKVVRCSREFTTFQESLRRDPKLQPVIELGQRLLDSLLVHSPGYMNAQTLCALAATNKRYLLTIAFLPTPMLLRAHEPRVVHLAQSIAFLSKSVWPKKNWLGLADEKAWESAKKNLTEFRSVNLPWGAGRMTRVEEHGSSRMMFSQDTQQLATKPKADFTYAAAREIMEGTSARQDLPKGQRYAHTFQGALSNLNLSPTGLLDREFSFIGQLAILLVGVEGTQNNMMTLHAPMCSDLVLQGKITWQEVLLVTSSEGNRMMPLFFMAPDAKDKGPSPMLRYSKVIVKGKFEPEGNDYEKFSALFRRQFDLHNLFFETFCPELGLFELNDRCDLLTIAATEYFLQSYFTDADSDTADRIRKRVYRQLKQQPT